MQATQYSLTRAFGYGLLISVGVFWLMHIAIHGGGHGLGKTENLPTIDFVRLKKDTDLELRTRKKPPKPEPPKQPPPPKMNVTPPPPEAPPVPFAMPKMNIPTTITGGPFLGTLAQGDMSGYSDLIPLVRINPQYPRQAMRDGISGWVQLEIEINPDGSVRSARPVAAQPRGVFESAAVQGVMKWRFKPKVVDGKPVAAKGLQRLEFNLGKDE
ncbi:MAG TPA: energy transducer TonB [Candidatus Binatia bacterium]|nr:energy transducer TonB [Candidatus Binatia bacterium]